MNERMSDSEWANDPSITLLLAFYLLTNQWMNNERANGNERVNE